MVVDGVRLGTQGSSLAVSPILWLKDLKIVEA
jgi:hypothetical protein